MLYLSFIYIFVCMKILLLGEYSRLHNSLKEGLEYWGHQVLLVATGDDFKQYPSDINVASKLSQNYGLNKLGQLVFRLTDYNIFKKEVYKNLKRIIPDLKDFDVVQLINEDAFGIYPNDEIKFYRQIFDQNKAVFLSACGEDHHIIDYYNTGKMRYSILNPFKENAALKKEAFFSYKYLTPAYKKLHDYVVEKVQAIIPSDLDYAIPYWHHPKATNLIPNPVNIDRILYNPPVITDKINIFFGINRLSYYKKGSHIILKALKIIETDYPDKVQIILAENLPYASYIQKYNDAHILIDQLYSYDQGYNALEAMAQGKCVLTGAELEFEDYYHLEAPVAVNVLPNVDDLVAKLTDLIAHPEKILALSKRARKFIEQHHNYKTVAQQYLKIWQEYT